jgi:type IV secretory pathway protease TraF
VPVTPQNGCRFGILRRIRIEAASHDRVKHAEKVVLVGREAGIAAPTDDNLWQIIHFIARAIVIDGAPFSKSLRQERLGRNMVAIALDVGNHGTTVDAPGLQPIISEILNFSHPSKPLLEHDSS